MHESSVVSYCSWVCNFCRSILQPQVLSRLHLPQYFAPLQRPSSTLGLHSIQVTPEECSAHHRSQADVRKLRRYTCTRVHFAFLHCCTGVELEGVLCASTRARCLQQATGIITPSTSRVLSLIEVQENAYVNRPAIQCALQPIGNPA